MSTDLKTEIEQAADQATKDMVIDPETLGGSKENEDTAGEAAKASQSDEGSVEDESDQEDAVNDPAVSEKQKVWKKPDSSDEETEEGDEKEEQQDGSDGDETVDSKGGENGEATAEINPATLARAHAVGVTLEDARTFRNDEELSNFVIRIEDGIKAQAQAEVQAEAQKEFEKQAEEEDPLKDLEINPDDFEDDVVDIFGKFKSVIKKQHEQINELRQGQVQAAKHSSEAMQREVTQWFDESIAGLGDEFADTLGSGNFNSLTPGSPQLAKRDEIATQVSIMLAGYERLGQSQPPRDKVFADAAQVVLGPELKKSQERKLQKKLADRQKGHISRAGGHTEKTQLSADDEVAQMLDEKYNIGR